MEKSFRLSLLIVLLCIPFVGVSGCSKHREKIKITRLNELPQYTYPISGKVQDLVDSREKIEELAKKVRANIQSDLDTYEINDPTTLKGMYSNLITIDMLEGKYNDALRRIEDIRKLEDKEAKKLMTGLTLKAMVSARRQAPPADCQKTYKKTYGEFLEKAVAALPWKVVQDSIQQSKGRLELMSPNLIQGIIQGQMEPIVAQNGELNADMANSVLGFHFLINYRLPLKDVTLAVYQKAIDKNKVVKPDIWAARSVSLSADGGFSPVLMGVWDSGTDENVFSEILFTNKAETADGTDSDGNGFVDDIHGIAYSVQAEKAVPLLCPLGDAADRMPTVMDHLKGIMDMQAAIDSPEAGALKSYISGLEPAEIEGFLEDLGLAGNYAHGTHVAGLMVDGNPFARLLIARLSYDHHTIPVPRTIEWGKRDAAKCRDTVEYFKKHGVRVVNMSWGEAQKDAESSLEKNGIGDSAEARREMADKVFAFQKNGLYEAIKNAPEILFVAAAGNADNNVEFDDDIPSSFDLPNLIVVGAVDQAGDPTSFTSFGPTVQVYANGFEVESYVPGGERMKMSGTSMASPNVANLAGKLLAVDPSLSPEELVEVIKKGADRKTAGKNSFLLMNPQKSIKLLTSKQ